MKLKKDTRILSPIGYVIIPGGYMVQRRGDKLEVVLPASVASNSVLRLVADSYGLYVQEEDVED